MHELKFHLTTSSIKLHKPLEHEYSKCFRLHNIIGYGKIQFKVKIFRKK